MAFIIQIEQIKKQGFEKPSPIQAQAWPVLLKGEDLIGIAQTGTGMHIVVIFLVSRSSACPSVVE